MPTLPRSRIKDPVKIVIAPDSFKEGLDAAAVARAIAQGVGDVMPHADIVCIPMADGGEGTVNTILAATSGERRCTLVQDALGAPVEASWGWVPPATAVIEMAAAAGLELIAPQRRDVLRASSYGVGELILAALESGARRIVLGLGGSATNDGGAGMLTALGARFLDADGAAVPPGGAALAQLASIDLSGLDPRLAQTQLIVASDVNTPLCGPDGAAAVFGPQKGATAADVKQLDSALARYASIAARTVGRDVSQMPGAGAAGGLGFAASAFLHGRFRPGVEVVAELVGLRQAVAGADLLFTGEGCLDAQTLHGKAPAGVARIAREAGVPVVALVGALGPGHERLAEAGITAAFSIVSGPMSLDEAYRQTAELLRARAREVMRLYVAFSRPAPHCAGATALPDPHPSAHPQDG